MFKLSKTPYEKETLEDWAKLSVDIAKVAILAIPVMLYGNDSVIIKLLNTALLSIGAYSGLVAGRKFRKMKEEVSQ